MNRDYYATLAQVLPVVLLTIVWDRDWLTKLSGRVPYSSSAPDGARFWTKPVVRWYSLAVAFILTSSIAACVLVLAGIVDDRAWVRIAILVAAAVALTTLFVRMAIGVIEATR